MAAIAAGVDLEALVRPAARATGTYHRTTAPAVTPPRSVRLDWNESPYGPSPRARAALARFPDVHRYPDIEARELRDALGRYVRVPGERVIVGAGLDDVMATMALLLIEPGDRVVISEPTFGLYRPLFETRGAEIVDVPLGPGFALDADGVVAAVAETAAKLVIVCTPNNPTGNLFDPAAVERVVAGAPCLVAIDEAYTEFAGSTHVDPVSYTHLTLPTICSV